MWKEEYRTDTQLTISQLYYSDEKVINAVIDLLRGSYAEQLARFFIYSDENYFFYFKAMLLDTQHYRVYYALQPQTLELVGFGIFKLTHRSLFLNQIIIAPAFGGQGFGSSLLKAGTENINSVFGKGYFRYLQLETFKSNLVANRWYTGLDMKRGAECNWYCITREHYLDSKLCANIAINQMDYEIATDAHSFLHVYYRRIRMGIIINKKRVRLKFDNQNVVLKLLKFLFEVICVDMVCVVARAGMNLPVLDTCISYRTPLSKLLSKL